MIGRSFGKEHQGVENARGDLDQNLRAFGRQ